MVRSEVKRLILLVLLLLTSEVLKGETLGWLGEKHENGGWPSHVHFQLSWSCPSTHDMPGTCTQSTRQLSLLQYPDPRLVLGPIY